MRGGSELQILAVSVYGDGHEDIRHLQWQGPSSSGITSAEALIRWLEEDPRHEAWLRDGEQRVEVEVATPVGERAYLRSRSSGQWDDHLLRLPRL